MFKFHPDGSVSWSEKKIVAGKSGLMVDDEHEFSRGAIHGDIWNPMYAQVVNTPIEGKTITLPGPCTDKIKELDDKVERRTGQTNHNFKVLENRIKNLKEEADKRFDTAALQDWSDYADLTDQICALNEELVKSRRERTDLYECVVDMWRITTGQKYQIQELQKEIEHLKESKIDRPSISQDLINAERYIDDLAAIERKYAQERFMRKNKLKEKVEEIKSPKSPKDPVEPVEISTLKSLAVTLAIVSTIPIGVGIGTILRGLF